MGTSIRCFLIQPTKSYRVTLRRYSKDTKCPSNNWCHNADTFIGIEDHEAPPSNGDSHPHDDLRWPSKCDLCDYVFVEDDLWQANFGLVFKTDDGREFTLTSPDQATNDKGVMAPPGAMWECSWMPGTGPDGKSYCVRTPGGDWHIDGDYRQGKWSRTGAPPNLTVTPSILIGQKADGGWQYHGWLRDGVLIEC
jgi:hypothetical protein